MHQERMNGSCTVCHLHFPHLEWRPLAGEELVPDEGEVPQPGQHHDGAGEALVADELPRAGDDLLDGRVAVRDPGVRYKRLIEFSGQIGVQIRDKLWSNFSTRASNIT